MQNEEFQRQLRELTAENPRRSAAEIVRENLSEIRERRATGVKDEAILEVINRESSRKISLVTLRCYLARRGRDGPSSLPAPGKRSAIEPQAPITERRHDVSEPGITVNTVGTAALSHRSEAKIVQANISAPPQPGEPQPARTEQRGVNQPITPGPVE